MTLVYSYQTYSSYPKFAAYPNNAHYSNSSPWPRIQSRITQTVLSCYGSLVSFNWEVPLHVLFLMTLTFFEEYKSVLL